MSPPVPGTGRRSNKDNERDLARLHAKIALQPLQDLWGFLCPSLRHGIQEIRCFLGPATSHFSRQNHQRGMWFPSPCELPAKPWWLRAVVQCRRHEGVTPGWCPRPTEPRARGTSMRRPSNGLKAPTSKSRMNLSRPTRPPASRQT